MNTPIYKQKALLYTDLLELEFLYIPKIYSRLDFQIFTNHLFQICTDLSQDGVKSISTSSIERLFLQTEISFQIHKYTERTKKLLPMFSTWCFFFNDKCDWSCQFSSVWISHVNTVNETLHFGQIDPRVMLLQPVLFSLSV